MIEGKRLPHYRTVMRPRKRKRRVRLVALEIARTSVRPEDWESNYNNYKVSTAEMARPKKHLLLVLATSMAVVPGSITQSNTSPSSSSFYGGDGKKEASHAANWFFQMLVCRRYKKIFLLLVHES